jgi:hypothetical protein
MSLLARRIHQSSFDDLNLFQRLVFRIRLHQAHPLHNFHAALHSAKDCMLPIQPRRRRKCNKELAPIRVRSTVCHTEHASASMLQGSFDLVFEFLAVDGAAAAAGASRVARLDHKIGDDAMENDVVVKTLLSESREILAGFGSLVVVEFDDDGTLQVVSKIPHLGPVTSNHCRLEYNVCGHLDCLD